MDNQPITTPASVSNQATEEAQQMLTQTGGAGNALLDAQIQAAMQPKPSEEEPSATNMTGNCDLNDPTKAENFTTTGDYPSDFKQLDDQGNLSMARNNASTEEST